MTKDIHISISEYAFDRIFLEYKGNRSKRAEELMLKGQDSEYQEDKTIRKKLHDAERKIKDISDENSKIKKEINILKEKSEKKNRNKNINFDLINSGKFDPL